MDGVDVLVGMCMRAHSVRVINADEGGFGGGNSNSSGGSMANLAIAGMSSSGNLRMRSSDENWIHSGRQIRNDVSPWQHGITLLVRYVQSCLGCMP